MSRARKKKEEMSGISLGVLSSGALAGADSRPVSPPDSEVVAEAKRRTYTAEYKQRILVEAPRFELGSSCAQVRRTISEKSFLFNL